jgi:hypothetical protein
MYHTQAIVEEFLVNSIFNKTKIQTMDMKVMAYSIFSWFFSKIKNKNLKAPWTMEDFSSQVLEQGSKDGRGNSQRAFLKRPSSSSLPFWADVVNSCSLALALARPTQSCSWIFISP